MSDTPARPPEDQPNPNPEEGSAEWGLGEREAPEGSPPTDDADARRRMESLRHHSQGLAKKHGLDVSADILPPSGEAPATERSKSVRRIAEPGMNDDIAAGLYYRGKTRKVTKPDGTVIEDTAPAEFMLLGRANLERSIKALGGILLEPFKWSGRMSFKCGKSLLLKVRAKQRAAEQEEEVFASTGDDDIDGPIGDV